MKRGFAKSLRDVKLANNAADRFYARMAGVEPVVQSQVAPKRIIKNRTPDEDLESGVAREVIQVVAEHRNVIWATRVNSGALTDSRGVPVFFLRWIKNSEKMKMTDIFGLATFGFFAIENKARHWQWAGTEREEAQKAFIDCIVKSGGRGGFVTCAEQALQLLK